MKTVLLSTLLLISASFYSQIPADIELLDLDGKKVKLSNIIISNKPVIISFWATWCQPCTEELDAINKVLSKWENETDVIFIAVSIDDNRSKGRVEPLSIQRNWDFTILLDPSGSFKNAMNVNNLPHTFLIDPKGKIVWDHNNYSTGDELELYNNLLKII